MRPLFDRVLVKPFEPPTKRNGLFLPSNTVEDTVEGQVIAVDPGKDTPLTVKVGDRVVFNRHAGTRVEVNGQDHRMIREDDLFGILEP